MQRTLLFVAAIANLSAGCVAATDREPTACEPGASRAALQADNGRNLNGIVLNALGFNAISYNAITYNAITWNAIGWNAIAYNGTRVRGRALVGLTLEGQDPAVGARLLGTTELDEHFELAITGMDRDPESGLTTYEVSVGDQTLCASGEAGFFLPGIWTDAGAHVPFVESDGVRFELTYACTPGVLAKCVRWGYAPEDAGEEMHETCVRLARADYCGDGVSHTENGTLIDVFDVDGRLTPDLEADPALRFEAGWGPDGAVCVSRPRYRVLTGGIEELPSCFAELPSCDTWDEAIAEGALLGNRSIESIRHVCAE